MASRTALYCVILNLFLFILATSSRAFRDLHHHWIFPALGFLLSAEWALAGGIFRVERLEGLLNLKAARSALLFLLGILLLMGVVRHQTILACIGGCSFKLGLAMALGAGVYSRHCFLNDDSFWGPARASTAALACALWALFLGLFGLGLAAWKLDAVFAVIAIALLSRHLSPAAKAAGLAIIPILLIRRFFGEYPIIFLSLAIVCAGLYAAGRFEGVGPGRPPEGRPC